MKCGLRCWWMEDWENVMTVSKDSTYVISLPITSHSSTSHPLLPSLFYPCSLLGASLLQTSPQQEGHTHWCGGVWPRVLQKHKGHSWKWSAAALSHLQHDPGEPWDGRCLVGTGCYGNLKLLLWCSADVAMVIISIVLYIITLTLTGIFVNVSISICRLLQLILNLVVLTWKWQRQTRRNMLRKCGVLDTAHAESTKLVLRCSPCKCSVCNSILLDLSLFPLSYSLPPSSSVPPFLSPP